MFSKVLTFGGTLLLAGAVFVSTPAAGQAAGPGGHFGGGHFGGGHFGGYHGGFHSGYSGGYSHYGSHPYYGYHPNPGSYYPYAGYYPYYGGGYFPNPIYNSGSSDIDPSYPPYPKSEAGSSDEVPLPTDPGGASSYSPEPPDNTAKLKVKVPADAEVWFDGTKTTSTGPVREFQSPALAPGQKYSYQVRARWQENGHEVTQTQNVDVKAGADIDVGFPVPTRVGGQTPQP